MTQTPDTQISAPIQETDLLERLSEADPTGAYRILHLKNNKGITMEEPE